MTAIACKIEKNEIHLASDSQTTWGTLKYNTRKKESKDQVDYGKIFELKGSVIALAGSVACAGLLRIYSASHMPSGMTVEGVLDWFCEFIHWADKRYAHQSVELHGIIIREGLAFAFHDFLEVYPVEGFTALGSGRIPCLSVMEVGGSASAAVATAIKYNLYCGGEVVLKKIPIDSIS